MKPIQTITLTVLTLFVCVFSAAAQTKVPADKVESMIEHIVNGPWTSHLDQPTNGTAVYMLHTRTCPFCKAFLTEERDRLLAAGIDVRIIPFPGKSDSADIIAQLAHYRDPDFFRHYDNGEITIITPSQTSPHFIDAFNATIAATQTLYGILDDAGEFRGTPAFAYVDQSGDWYTVAGYSERVFGPVRAALMARAAATDPVPAPKPTVPLQDPHRPVIPGCDALLSWGAAASAHDRNLRPTNYSRSNRHAGRTLLWGLQDEQIIPVFGVSLAQWSDEDIETVRARTLSCMNGLVVNYTAAKAAWGRSRRQTDPTAWRANEATHTDAHFFFNVILNMRRPSGDYLYHPLIMQHQRELAQSLLENR